MARYRSETCSSTVLAPAAHHLAMAALHCKLPQTLQSGSREGSRTSNWHLSLRADTVSAISVLLGKWLRDDAAAGKSAPRIQSH